MMGNNFVCDSQISYSSGSPALSDRSRFKMYFRNSPTSDIVAPTLRATVEHFNWTRVAVITQQEALFTIVRNTVHMHAASRKIIILL